MAVAVKNPNPAPTKPTSPQLQLVVASWVGVLYVLGSLTPLVYALPILWKMTSGQLSEFFTTATLPLGAAVAASVGLLVFGARMAGSHPLKGFRGGVFLGTVAVVAVAFVTWCVGSLLEAHVAILQGKTGQFVTLAVGVALLAVVVKYSWLPVVGQWAVAVEDQGWFVTTVYKKSQGFKVRWGTLIGVLVLGGAGAYSLLSHGTGSGSASAMQGIGLGLAILAATGVVLIINQSREGQSSERGSWIGVILLVETVLLLLLSRLLVWSAAEVDQLKEMAQRPPPAWTVSIPFGGTPITILPDVYKTLPLILMALTVWGGYRVVNFPAFADFLIATEAELNKVSWTSWRRLIQDTMVVLTTLILFTFFLFFVDVFWGWFLTTIGIIAPPAAAAKALESRW